MELQEGGLVLGVDGDARYNASTVTLDPGDVLVLYTDGVVEVPDPGGKEFGLKGLERTIRGAWNLSATDMIQSVVRSTESLIGSAGYDDDFTLMVVKRMEK